MVGLGATTLVAIVVGAGLALAGAGGAFLSGRLATSERMIRVALPVLAALAVAATAMLGWALATSDFTIAYVAQQSRRGGSLGYRVAGLWGGMAGSLLLWIALLAVIGLVATTSLRRSPNCSGLASGTGVVFIALVGSFAAILAVWARPFQRLGLPPLDGQGLTPILEHPAMLYHPPILYLGLISLAAPFAVTVVGGARRQLDRHWLATCRRWMLASWTLLAMGMLAGAHWAYVELGWGGFWAWDPVENTALLPWLAVTAFLHQGVRERDGHPSDSGWLLPGFVIVAFVLALVGTTLTRSGATPSVHAFAEDATIGWALALIAATVAAGAVVAIARGARSRPAALVAPPNGSSISSNSSISSIRTAALGVYVVLVLIVLAIVATGTVYPAVVSNAAAVGGHYFAVFAGPIALGVLVLMIAIPVSSGRRGVSTIVGATAASMAALVVAFLAGWRDPFAIAVVATAGAAGAAALVALARERRPAHLAHLGFVLLMAGIAGSTTAHSVAGTLGPDEALGIGSYTIRNHSVELHDLPGIGNHEVVATVTVERGGDVVATLQPSLLVRQTRALVLAESSLRSTPLDDVQVALRDAGDDGEALLEVAVRPLVWWVWWGALLLVAGGGWTTIAAIRGARAAHSRRTGEAQTPIARLSLTSSEGPGLAATAPVATSTSTATATATVTATATATVTATVTATATARPDPRPAPLRQPDRRPASVAEADRASVAELGAEPASPSGDPIATGAGEMATTSSPQPES